MVRSRPLPPRELDDVLREYGAWRQSRLGDADNCMLATLWQLEREAAGRGEWHTPEQARGILFHRYAAEVLRTLRETGQATIPEAEALEILYEVCAQRDVPDSEVVYAPARERRLLRIAAVLLVTRNRFGMARLIDVERRLFAEVAYPNPDGGFVSRTITGQPDALLADPPTPADPTSGAIVLDWKTTPKAPPAHDDEQRDAPAAVSYLGYFQQRVYALLVFANYPAVERVTLREFYVLEGVARKAVLYRDRDLERVQRELSVLVELLDRAVRGGSKSELWKPTPGKHCAYCPKPTQCPIEADVRAFAGSGGGGIATQRDAARFAAEYVLATQTRTALHEALKAWHEATGQAIPVKSGKGRYVVRWGETPGGARRFGLHVPAESDRGPADPRLEDVFREAAARRKAAAA